MKRITILSIFPEMFDGFLHTSIIDRAIKKGLVEVQIIDFRKYTTDKHNKVDDYPFGGGQGMILMCQPIIDALKDIRKENSLVLQTSPLGITFNQAIAHKWANEDDIIILCGHYEGFDERISNYIDEKVSIGDYILTGGELGAMVISDAIIRLLEGVIAENSSKDESFENDLLEYPQYTRPVEYDGLKVPDVLLSGHHENIRKYRLKESLKTTYLHRPDLLEKHKFTKEEIKLLQEIKEELDN